MRPGKLAFKIILANNKKNQVSCPKLSIFLIVLDRYYLPFGLTIQSLVGACVISMAVLASFNVNENISGQWWTN